VPVDYLDLWSALLEDFDSGLAPYVPLGENGGTLGKVRDQDTGEPVSGVHLISQHPSTLAQIFYLDDDGQGLNTEATGASGHFLVLDAQLAEKFDAYRDDELISSHEATLAQAFGCIYTTSIHVDDDDL